MTAVVTEPADRLALYLTSAIGLRPVEIARRQPRYFAASRAVAQHLLRAVQTLWQADVVPDLLGRAPAAVACVQPGTVPAEDLMAAALGERSRRLREHVQHCAGCAVLTERYAAGLRALAAALFRFDCPPPLALGEHVAGGLPAARHEEVAAHLGRCPHCAAEQASIAGFLATDDPAALTALPGAVREVVASFEAAASRWPRGRRPATLVFTADDVRLTLHPQPADKPRDQVLLLGFAEQAGQPLSGLAGASVHLLRGADTIGRTTIDAIGSFQLGPAPQDRYTLQVTVGALRLVVHPLDLMLT
jgi:hypothetical protein